MPSLSTAETTRESASFAERVRINQARLTRELKPRYDFIVCGAGSSGSVIARRLAENPDVSVLLVEAGGDDDIADVMMPERWTNNLESRLSWHFHTEPSNPHVNYRSIAFPMGKVLGGGSSINAMVWSRGHRTDWELFAEEADDKAWCYESVLNLYRSIEHWGGAPDPDYRGSGGLVFVQPVPHPNPLAPTTLDAARSIGIKTYPNPNAALMEAGSGAAIADVTLRNGRRKSIFRSYTYPLMDRLNLTVLSHTLVTRVLIDRNRATGVEVIHDGQRRQIGADAEVVLSLGALNTPKVLMHSGVGDEAELSRFDIPVLQHLPGVGANLQDHVAFDCIWEYRVAEPARNNGAEVVVFGETTIQSSCPDVFTCQIEIPYATPANITRFGLPAAGWTLHSAITHPKSRGRVHLTGSQPGDPITIRANTLSHPDDLRTAIACVQWCREIGNAPALRPYVKREALPGNLKGRQLTNFVRNAATTFFHQAGTAQMGRGEMAVVNGKLAVYGIDGLRVADASIMPQITLGNTMAPCVVIGERAAEILTQHHGLGTPRSGKRGQPLSET